MRKAPIKACAQDKAREASSQGEKYPAGSERAPGAWQGVGARSPRGFWDVKKGREAGGALDQAAGGSACSSVSVSALARLLLGGVLTLLAPPCALVPTDPRRRDAITKSAGFPLRKPGLLPGFACDGHITPRLRVSLPSRTGYRPGLPLHPHGLLLDSLVTEEHGRGHRAFPQLRGRKRKEGKAKTLGPAKRGRWLARQKDISVPERFDADLFPTLT